MTGSDRPRPAPARRGCSPATCSTWTGPSTWATTSCRARPRPWPRCGRPARSVAFLTNKPLRRPGAYAAKLTGPGHPGPRRRGRDRRRCAACGTCAAGAWRADPADRRAAARDDCSGTPVSPAGSDRMTRRARRSSSSRGIARSTTRSCVAAFRAVRAGARIVATNPDPFCPDAGWRPARLRGDARRARGIHRVPAPRPSWASRRRTWPRPSWTDSRSPPTDTILVGRSAAHRRPHGAGGGHGFGAGPDRGHAGRRPRRRARSIPTTCSADSPNCCPSIH